MRIMVPDVPMGGKPFLIRRAGMYVLEEGPGMLQTIDVTHAGSDEFSVYDGVPDERGFFPEGDLEEGDPGFGSHNGNRFSHFSPTVMGAWMMNAGFRHGLTIEVTGGSFDVAPFATVVWTPFKTGNRTSGKFPVEKPAADIDMKLAEASIKDVRTQSAKGSLTRAVAVSRLGLTRIARRSSELYSVMITHGGSFCRLILRNGLGVPLFDQLSCFTGSFVMGAGAEGGIIVDVDGMQQPPLLQLNWREADLQVV